MLMKVFILFFLADFTWSKPQGDCTDRPLPHRPFYQPNPSYELISQIIPPGEPWPASVVDYGIFSQTKPPNYTPLWAAPSRPTAPTKPPPAATAVNILRPTSSPVNLEERLRETERPDGDFAWFWPEQNNEKLISTGRTTTVKKTSVLFTSAPAVLTVRIDDDEPKLENVRPVNLIPDKFMVTMKPPRPGGSTATKRTPSSATVRLPTRKPTQQQTVPDYGFNSFFKK